MRKRLPLLGLLSGWILFFLPYTCSAQSDVDPVLPALDQFFGFTDIALTATGHYRTERIHDRWYLVTPTGHPYVALGANHVGKFFKRGEQAKDLLERFGGNSLAAAEAVYGAMLDLHCTAGEAYAPLHSFLKRRMPYVVNVDFPGGDKFRFDPFDGGFRLALRQAIATACRPLAQDSLVLGIAFADLPIWDSRRADYFRSLPAEAPGKVYYLNFLRRRYGTVETLNTRYGTTFSSFNNIDSIHPRAAAVVTDDEAFVGQVADTLYRLLADYTGRYAPEKLFFGERFVLRMAPEAVLRSVGKYVDVFCTQALILSPQRPPEWQVLQPEAYAAQHRLVGDLPMLVIDWAAPFSLDSTYRTDRGEIREEAVASNEAARWLEKLFDIPYVVGAFKCQLIGTHGNDRWFPAGRMKRTYLRDDGTPYAIRTPRTASAHKSVLVKLHDHLTEDGASKD